MPTRDDCWSLSCELQQCSTMQREHWVDLLAGGGVPNGAVMEARLHSVLRRICQKVSTRREVDVMQAGKPVLCGIGFVVMTVIMNSSMLRSQNAIDEIHIQRR